MSSQLLDYLRSGRHVVDGWFLRADAEAYYAILSSQNDSQFSGSMVEIGLHHGKSFIPLCLALRPGEMAYGIDIFDQQDLNLDRSGRGELDTLKTNLRRFGIAEASIKLDGRNSNQVSPDDILRSVGAARFFSVDGGHWADLVCNDLSLAERVIAPHGVIALDDFLRPEWPDVSAGFFRWMERRTAQIVPFAIGFNKLYLCHLQHLERYRDALLRSPSMGYFWSKNYDFYGNTIPIYQKFPLPQFGWKQRLWEYLKLFHQDFFVTLKSLRSKNGLSRNQAITQESCSEEAW